MIKQRLRYFAMTIMLLLVGLASRQYSHVGSFVHDYLGDAIWAGMIYVGLRMLFPQFSLQKTALMAIIFTYSIEISQLYQADWLNALRHTTLGGLILGFGFLWSDLVMYFLGIFGMMWVDRVVANKIVPVNKSVLRIR
jgi:Protein of unknown function (DUF2809)